MLQTRGTTASPCLISVALPFVVLLFAMVRRGVCKTAVKQMQAGIAAASGRLTMKHAKKNAKKTVDVKHVSKVLSAHDTSVDLTNFIAGGVGNDDAAAYGSTGGVAASRSSAGASVVVKKPSAAVKCSVKKPAAAVKGSVKKKPAAAVTGSMTTPAVRPEDAGQSRDRMKDYYFKEALKNDSLDGELHDLWLKVKGNRAKETALINGVMTKAPGGKFHPDKNSPRYQEFYSKITANYWKDEQKAIPESLAIIKFKSKDALLEAVRNGDVNETVDSGKKYYSWRTISIGTQGKSQTNINVNKAGTIDHQTYDKLSKSLENLKWNFSFTMSQQHATTVGGDLPTEALEKVDMARAALAKVSKQAVATLGQMKSIRDNDLVKQGQATMSEFLVKIRTAENILEAVSVMGTGEDGKNATCQGVLRTLGSTAKLLEDTFLHVKACAGLLRGTK